MLYLTKDHFNLLTYREEVFGVTKNTQILRVLFETAKWSNEIQGLVKDALVPAPNDSFVQKYKLKIVRGFGRHKNLVLWVEPSQFLLDFCRKTQALEIIRELSLKENKI